jgi:hypothetical protein
VIVTVPVPVTASTAGAKINRDVVKLDTRHCIVNVMERLTSPAAWFGIEIHDILFAGVSFIHGNLQRETTGHLTEGAKNTTFSAHFSKSLRKRARLSAGIDKFSPFRQATDG